MVVVGAALFLVRAEVAVFLRVLVGVVDPVLPVVCAMSVSENRGTHKYRRTLICVSLSF